MVREQTKQIFDLSGDLKLESSLQRARKLFVEGILLSGMSFLVAEFLGFKESGIFAVFLTSAALSHRLDRLLQENRDNIWVHHATPWKANRLTAVSVLTVFLAVTVVFSGMAAFFDRNEVYQNFAFVLEMAGFNAEIELHRRFPTISGIIIHNLKVLVTVVALGFVYRSYGALLALVWNASVWGIIITLLLKDAYTKTSIPAFKYVTFSLTAFLPHLVLEAFSYILAALAAIFVSRGLSKYGFHERKLKQVLKAACLMVAVSTAVLVVAGLVEGTLAPNMLKRIR
ncbi:MAG: stage II sporulation protein M [Myxococcota bacterium]|nr:stage II sporulation protein M [Myxococcota bacterium]